MIRIAPDDTLAQFCTAGSAGTSAPRVAVVVAHPDDEVIGAGARLGALTPELLVHVTDGAPRDLADAKRAGCDTREQYAARRRAERDSAAELMGIAENSRISLGIVDQETGSNLEPISLRLATLLAASDADVVLTHPYEGGHPDHDATAFAVRAACRLLRRAGERTPVVIELTSYHAGGNGIRVSKFLPGSGFGDRAVRLNASERERKAQLYDCYSSQAPVLEAFPIRVERFRLAPLYDFSVPPHPGSLYYERWPWGMTWSRWRTLARDALFALDLGDEQ